MPNLRICSNVPVEGEHNRFIIFASHILLGRLNAGPVHPPHKGLGAFDKAAHDAPKELVHLMDSRADHDLGVAEGERDTEEGFLIKQNNMVGSAA